MRMTPNEVGPIPKTWRACAIRNVATKITNGFVGVATPHYSESGAGVRYLLGTNIRPNRITSENLTFVSSEFSARSAKSILTPGDLLTVQSGHIGTTAVVPNEFAGANCHALIITRLDKHKAHSGFVSQYLNSNIGKARLKGLHVGSSIPHINTSELGAFSIPLPPLEEQQRISAIADTWDKAIVLTEHMVANSREQRQALITQIMRKSSCWKRTRLGSISERVRRRSNGGNYPVLMISASSGFVLQSEMYSRFMAGKSLESYILLRQGEFAYNKGNSKAYEFGCIYPLKQPEQGLVPNVYICFNMDDRKCFRPFYEHLFECDYLHDQLGPFVNTGVRNNGLLNIRPSDFFNVHVPVPCIEEQQRIAGILDVASESVRALEQHVSKLKAEKAALMQQLLTGKRRVRMPATGKVESA